MSGKRGRRVTADALSVFALTVWTAVIFWTYHAPVLAADDWTAVLWWQADGRGVDFSGGVTGSRPLLPVVLGAMGVTGLYDVHARYLALWLANLGVAVGAYAVFRRALGLPRIPALLAAALSAAYPANATGSWLTMFAIRAASVLAFVHILCVERVLAGRRHYAGPAALALLTCLLVYEGTLGVVLVWPLAAWYRWREWEDRRGLLLAPAVLAVYGVGRLGLFGGATDHRAERVVFAPVELIERLLLGAKLNTFAWLEPLRAILGSHLIVAVALAASMLAAGSLAYRFLGRGNGARDTDAGRRPVHVLAGALVLGLAGYFPIALVIAPRLRMYDSRTNEFAAIGLSLAIVAVVWTSISWIQSPRVRDRVLVGATVPALLLAGATQVAVRHDRAVAWAQQRGVWLELLRVVPDVIPGTYVILDTSLYAARDAHWLNIFGMPAPLDDLTAWDTTNAARFFYGKTDVTALSLKSATPDGSAVIDFRTGAPVPTSALILVSYDARGKARILESATVFEPRATSLGFDGYDPESRIVRARALSPVASTLLQATAPPE